LRILLFPLLPTLALAADPIWPQFREPNSNPIAPDGNLPDHWSLTKNVEWSTPIPGRGWSSPIGAGRQIFLTAAVTEGLSK